MAHIARNGNCPTSVLQMTLSLSEEIQQWFDEQVQVEEAWTGRRMAFVEDVFSVSQPTGND